MTDQERLGRSVASQKKEQRLAEMQTWPDCPDCNGSGEITWNPSRIGDPQCEQSARCHRCGGFGAINEKEGECAS